MEKHDWTKYELTVDGQFACRYCKGTKEIQVGKRISKCWGCDGSGYMVDTLANDLVYEKSRHDNTREELKKLSDWITKTSKCTICKGNSYNTLGSIDCPECGLAGNKPWGG